MMAHALAIMYHDVVEGDAWDSSGFPGEAAGSYKLSRENFAAHLAAVGRLTPRIHAPLADQWDLKPGVFFTFDDGGSSFYEPIAGMLESHGWRGHFFITTDRIDTAGFVTREQLRQMRRRGHVIGSHSCSHPTRMSQLSREQLLREWTESKRALEQILGEPVTVASVPGGYYSTTVGRTAEEAGLRTLFHSEPTSEVDACGGCRLIGRYVVRRDSTPELSAGLAAGRPGPRLEQWAQWKAKKAAKLLAGDLYLFLRGKLLGK